MGSLKSRSFTSHLTVVGLRKKPQRTEDAWLVSDTSRTSMFLPVVEIVVTKVSLPKEIPAW